MLIWKASNQNIKSTKHVLANSDKNVQNFKQRLALSEDLCWKFNETRSFQNSHFFQKKNMNVPNNRAMLQNKNQHRGEFDPINYLDMS